MALRRLLDAALLCLSVLGLAGIGICPGIRQPLQVRLDRTLPTIARTGVASSLDGPGGKVHEERPGPLTPGDSLGL